MPKGRERLSAETADSAEDQRPPEAFEEFYQREYQGVVALTYGLSGSRAAAEDLAQEAFLAAHRDWDRVGAWEHRDAWVRRVAANLAVSSFRTRLAEARALMRLAGQRQPRVEPLPAGNADFWRTVRRLPKRQAQAVALYYLEDLPVQQIAEILGCSQGAVKAHLFKGRQTLARRLSAEIGADP
jgi:RNA polymerase sigma-70 factor (sigma-E family)